MWLLLACPRAPDDGLRVPTDTGSVPDPRHTGSAPGHSAEPPTGDTGVAAHTGPPVEELVATPGPGAYAGPVEVDLGGVTGAIVYTIDGSVPEFGVSPEWTGPLALSESTLIRARGRTATGDEVGFAGVWLQLDPSLATFDGELPVLVFWSVAEAPADLSDTYSSYTLTVFEPGAGARTVLPGEGTNSGRAGIRVRGSSSAWYPKRPYRVELWDDLDDGDRTVRLLGMDEDGDWVLGAPADFDRALMRNSLMYALSNDAGRWAPRTTFAEVFVAERREAVGYDDYVGVYEVTDRIEPHPDRVPITELLPGDVAPPAVTGGYLFKEDRLPSGETGFSAGTSGGLSFQQPFVWESPSEAEVAPEQRDFLVGELDELGVALTSPGFVHPVTGRSYQDIVDVDAFIDHHALNLFAKNPDAFRLSGYFFQERSEKLQAGPIWDFDRTLGCASDDRAADPTWWDASNETGDCTYMFDHGFWGGLFDDPVFRDRYFARLQVLLDGPLSVGSVHARIDAYAAQLDEAAPRNLTQWPDWQPRGGTFQAEVDLLKDWVAQRHAWMEGCLALPDPRTCRGS
jgi:hypothetical protein